MGYSQAVYMDTYSVSCPELRWEEERRAGGFRCGIEPKKGSK